MSGSMSSSTPEKSAGKSKAAKPIPQGYHTITPYLVVDGAQKVIEFLKKTFDAKEAVRITAPGNKVGHVELKIGDSTIMIGDAMMDFNPMPANLYVYVDDADKSFQRALQAGGKSVKEPSDQFYGDRAGCVRDPAGNTWWMATHVEDVSEEELKRRAQEMQHKMEKPQ
jgi:PhnB protein